MAHAPSCSGRVYGCPKCGKDEMTINESFDHKCEPVALLARAFAGVTKKGRQVGTCRTREDAEVCYGRRGYNIVEVYVARALKHNDEGDVLCPACGHHDVAMWADDGEAWAADWWACETFSGGCGQTGPVVASHDHARTQNGVEVAS